MDDETDWEKIMRELHEAEKDELRRAYMQSLEPFGPTVEAKELWIEYGTRTTAN